MDNSPQDDKGKESSEKDSKSQGIDDIHFEESFDIDQLQKKLLERIDQSNSGIEQSDEPAMGQNPLNIPEDKTKIDIPKQKAHNDPTSKKYVIYINQNNIDFMESLSNNERREVINKVLKEQKEISIQKKEFEAKKRLVIHAILAFITFIICFPILFIMVNKAAEITVNNYSQARQNFTKLYKEKGRIQMKN